MLHRRQKRQHRLRMRLAQPGCPSSLRTCGQGRWILHSQTLQPVGRQRQAAAAVTVSHRWAVSDTGECCLLTCAGVCSGTRLPSGCAMCAGWSDWCSAMCCTGTGSTSGSRGRCWACSGSAACADAARRLQHGTSGWNVVDAAGWRVV